MAIVRLLLDRGADVNPKIITLGYHLHTALEGAAWGSHEIIVRLLVDRGTNVEIYGGYALYAAAVNGDEAIAHLLLD